MDGGIHAESSEFEPRIAPTWFIRHTPIRRSVEQPIRSERINAQSNLSVGIECRVNRTFDIDRIVDKRVAAKTDDALCKATVENWNIGRPDLSEWRVHVGEGPGGRRVPRILNGRVVVGGNAIGDVDSAKVRGICEPNVSVIPRPRMTVWTAATEAPIGLAVVTYLREGTDVVDNETAIHEVDGR